MRLPSSGDLRRRVTIRYWQDSPNVAFGLTPVFTEDYTCWAKIEPVGGSIYWGSKQTGDTVTHRVIVRYVAGKTDPASITGEHVIESEGTRYRVRRVSDINDARRFVAVEVEQLGDVA